MEEVEETEKKELKAKKVSLVSKIISGILLVTMFILKCFNIINCDVNELIKVCFALAVLWATVDLNITLDKFIK